jgi:hypothetical protein
MLVSMTVRCEQCGHESDPRYRFCGMCGAKLPPPPPPEPIASKPVREEPMRQVSGPSFLGLAEEPSSSVTYLLEDEMSERHWGRALVLFLILGALGAAGWHWRSEVRAYVVARLAQHPNSNNQPEQTGYAGGPVSTSASETAGQTPSATVPVQNQDTAANQTPAAATPAGQQPSATTNNGPAASEQSNAASASAPAGSASPAPTGQAAAPAAPQEQANNAPAATPAKQESAAEPATPNEPTAKSESPTTKRAKSKAKETAEGTASTDELEAEGERYLYGTGVYANCSRAQKDLQAAADQGSSKADSVLGTMYATGHCVNRDLPLAYRWFAMALQRDPGNTRLQGDLQVLWNQMSADERQIAMRRQ